MRRNEITGPFDPRARARFVKIRINRFQLDQFFPITPYLFPDSEQAYCKTIVRLPAGVYRICVFPYTVLVYGCVHRPSAHMPARGCLLLRTSI